MATPTAPIIEPDLYQLSGIRDWGINITYSTTSFIGQPQLQFNNHGQVRNFTGSEITVQDSPIGQLVTVLLEQIPDLRTVTLTLILPNISLRSEGESINFQTMAVITINNTSIIGPFPGAGLRQAYHFIPLRGTARFVFF